MASSTLTAEHIERVIGALQAIKYIRQHYASGPEGARLVKEITTSLREVGENLGVKLYVNVAEAIDRSLVGG